MAGLHDTLFEKALLAIKDRDLERAAGLLVETLKLKPDFAEAWVCRGNVRMAQEQSFDALLHYDRAIEINPALYDAWNNSGVAFSNVAMWAMAEKHLRRSAEIMPSLDPHMNLGNMFCARAMLPEGEAQYRKCLEHEPQNLDAHINLGLTLLGQGRWDEGWPHYEARHANTPYQTRQRRLFKAWAGEPLEGKNILLYPEQGLGDELMFMRFATLVKKAGARRVTLEAMPPLVRLARTVEGVDEVLLKGEANPERFAYACAIMDIPMVLGIEPETIPQPKRYLRTHALPHLERPSLPPGLNVGLCWQSGMRPLQPEARATALNKSVHLLWLKPLADMGVNLISLQKDNPEPRLSKEMGLIDLMGSVSDLADTAGIIEQLDLVISVDTAVAHLAGALGVPVWNLVRHSGYWPWMGATRETVWYPSMRIYRQPTTFVWEEPLNRLFADMREFVDQWKADAA